MQSIIFEDRRCSKLSHPNATVTHPIDQSKAKLLLSPKTLPLAEFHISHLALMYVRCQEHASKTYLFEIFKFHDLLYLFSNTFLHEGVTESTSAFTKKIEQLPF